MDITIILKIGACLLTAVWLAPQVVKLFMERKADHSSIMMLTVLLMGLISWIYFMIGD
ncbi:MAG TPA: PQ-loop domain-containing transporter [Chryseolinea sp.]|nr:PQ-loop domain-containing transporter [Chryseolinea sp.]